MPLVAGSWPTTAQAVGETRSELLHHRCAVSYEIGVSENNGIGIAMPISLARPQQCCHIRRYLPPQRRTIGAPFNILKRSIMPAIGQIAQLIPDSP
jgi:hypothetical protein